MTSFAKKTCNKYDTWCHPIGNNLKIFTPYRITTMKYAIELDFGMSKSVKTN